MVGLASDAAEESVMTGSRTPEQALQWCRDLVKQRAGNFFWGLRMLPEPKRSGLFALYAWMRDADDIADSDTEIPIATDHLNLFAANTATLFDGGSRPEGPMWEGIAWAVNEFDLPRKPFDDMIEGQRHDLEQRCIETAEDLLEYCRCVASTVGELCIQIWGYADAEAPQLAVQRGIALQLTNILRDVGEDLERGRCYLPSQDLQHAGLSVEDLATWDKPKACEQLTRNWIHQADAYYQSSAPLDKMISRDCRPTLQAMTGIYHALLRRLAARPSRSVLGPRARLSMLGKLSIALRARAGAR